MHIVNILPDALVEYSCETKDISYSAKQNIPSNAPRASCPDQESVHLFVEEVIN
jgi:hypothetical protein